MSLSQITELDLDSGKTKFYKQEVLDLYYRVLCNSNSWDLGLGFFSLSSIKLLAYPLAKFILNNNGKMRVYCNERLSENDYNIISENKVIPLNKSNVFNDLNTLYDSLKGNDQELFSQCIAFLIQTDRIEFKVLVCKDSSRGISHHKNSIFKDDNNNTVVLSGSANASEQAFIFNREDTNAFCSFWNEKSSNKTINTTINEFEKTFHEGDEDWNILEIDSKELKDKLDEIGFRKIDSLSLDKKTKSFSNSKKNLFSKSIHDEIDKEIKTINDQPHFPIFDGIISKPRKYQIDAYNAWVNNNYSGIFAMATGTGKTITSLNCILNHYLATSNYHVIILVPTNILVSQWEKEANKFNFSNVYSSLNKWLDELRSDLFLLNNKRGENFIFITTYSTFNGKKFQDILKFKDLSNLVLLADEVHNLGSKKSLNNNSCVGFLIKNNRINNNASIVIVSSISGHRMTFNFHYAYSISKAGLIAMTKSIANELSSKLIRVNTVAPGMVDSPMNNELNSDNYFSKIDKAKYLLGKQPSTSRTLLQNQRFPAVQHWPW